MPESHRPFLADDVFDERFRQFVSGGRRRFFRMQLKSAQ